MKKTVVYAFDALKPNESSSIAKDLNDPTIGKIIIPTFLLKEIKRNFNFNQLHAIIKLLSTSSKVEYIDFPTIYSVDDIHKAGACYRNFVLCLVSKLKKYKNLFVKTDNFDLMLECIKRNFRIFIREEYSSKLVNYCEELKDNIVATKTKSLVIDTSYFVYMFKEKIGLNMLFDPNIKKLILSVNLEELIKMQSMDVFYLLVLLLNNRKKYNIKYIVENKAYDKSSCSYIHDLLIITSALENVDKEDLTICSTDLEFVMQCLALGINTIQTVIQPQNNNSNEDEKIIELDENSNSSNHTKSFPIKMKANTAYLSTRYILIAYEDVASKMYAKSFKFHNKSFFKATVGKYVKIYNQQFLYKIIEINKNNHTAKLERTNLKA